MCGSLSYGILAVKCCRTRARSAMSRASPTAGPRAATAIASPCSTPCSSCSPTATSARRPSRSRAAPGVSLRSVYRYFADRGDLIRAAVDRHLERVAATVRHRRRPATGRFEPRVESFVRRADARLRSDRRDRARVAARARRQRHHPRPARPGAAHLSGRSSSSSSARSCRRSTRAGGEPCSRPPTHSHRSRPSTSTVCTAATRRARRTRSSPRRCEHCSIRRIQVTADGNDPPAGAHRPAGRRRCGPSSVTRPRSQRGSPGIVDAKVDGTTRVITTASGHPDAGGDRHQRPDPAAVPVPDHRAASSAITSARSTCSISATARASSRTRPTASPTRWRSSSAARPGTRCTSCTGSSSRPTDQSEES